MSVHLPPPEPALVQQLQPTHATDQSDRPSTSQQRESDLKQTLLSRKDSGSRDKDTGAPDDQNNNNNNTSTLVIESPHQGVSTNQIDSFGSRQHRILQGDATPLDVNRLFHHSLPRKPVAAAAAAAASAPGDRGSWRGRELFETTINDNRHRADNDSTERNNRNGISIMGMASGMATSQGTRRDRSRDSRDRDDRGLGRDREWGREQDADREQSEHRPLVSRLGSQNLQSHSSASRRGEPDLERERLNERSRGEWRDLPPHRLPPRPRGVEDSPRTDSRPGSRSDSRAPSRPTSRPGSPPRRERDGRDVYRPHDTYRPGDREREREPDPRSYDRDRERDGRDSRDRDDRGGERDPYQHRGDMRSQRGSGPNLTPRDQQHHARPHSMPPFRPTLGMGGGGPPPAGSGAAPAHGNASPGGAPIPGPANLEERRQLREETQVDIWPPSPSRPYAEILDDENGTGSKDKDRSDGRRNSKKRSSRRSRRRYTSETDSESEDERRRRKRRTREKERDRDRDRERDRDRDDDKERERRRRRADSELDERDRDRDRDRRKDRDERDSKRERERDRDARARQPSEDQDPRRRSLSRSRTASAAPADDGPEVGPQLPASIDVRDNAIDREAYRDLLPGEGAAMAAFLEKGQRIPRRGEIGMDQAQIAALEGSGYVMSGSRHGRMTAVRLRKEGQVINAEEKRAMVMQQRDDWNEKEGAIISLFKEMMDERLKMEEKKERERERDKEGKGKGKRRE